MRGRNEFGEGRLGWIGRCDVCTRKRKAGAKPTSQRQADGTVRMDLTMPEAFAMMRPSSARRRHGQTRDVSRTSVSEAGQPSQRADWARP